MLRTAIVLKFNLCTYCLRHGRIDIGPRIGGVVIGWRRIIGIDNALAPGVREIDACSSSYTGVIRVTLVTIGIEEEANGAHQLFGRKHSRDIALIGKSISDAPTHIGLLHIGDRLILQ